MHRLALAALSLLACTAAGAAELAPYDPARYSQEVTECDRLAAHPDDPHRVAPGRSQKDVDLARAIPACEQAVAADPKNPRLNYQLARVYGYAGIGEKAGPYRDAAVAADYPQALFVVGYLHLYGLNKQPKDVCRAGELIRRSALAGRFAGLVGFVRWSLDGTFSGCAVRQDLAELRGFLAEARRQAGEDFYKGLLIATLEDEIGVVRP